MVVFVFVVVVVVCLFVFLFPGELGWEIHVPTEHAPSIYCELMERGKEFGVHPFGSYAMNSLRMEKGFRAWGSEVRLGWIAEHVDESSRVCLKCQALCACQ